MTTPASETISQTLSSLHPLEHKLLAVFKDQALVNDDRLLSECGLDEARLNMAVGWLLAKGLLTAADSGGPTTTAAITDLGKQYLEDGLPGLRIVKQLHSGSPVTISDLRNILEPTEVSRAIGELKTGNLVRIGQGGSIEVIGDLDHSDIVRRWKALGELIGSISEKGGVEVQGERLVFISEYAGGRGKKGIFDLHEKRHQTYGLTEMGQGVVERLATETPTGEELAQLTPDLLKDGSWKDASFRKYNIALPAPRIAIGRKHPYREFLDDVKQRFLAMGFEEMRGGLVESEFWNMDALYMPQFHPARDIHDVYYLKEPTHSSEAGGGEWEQRLFDAIAAAHTSGGETGSRGWRYPFDTKRSRRLMLRSQGTAVSAKTLASGPKVPGKYFSIARCFRYEQVDATHAQDFFQIEGIVLGDDIHFRSLLGLLTLFAEEVARAREIKFLPAYFPFTEPSVELHVKHPKLGWMELGGAGIFRPEVTLPLGISVPVIAWGLGLDRMAMVALGIHDIRDLFSPDLDRVRTMRPGLLA